MKELIPEYSMPDIKEYYVFGLPIQTEIGYCHFIKVKEFPDYAQNLRLISCSKNEILYLFTKNNKNGQHNETINFLKGLSLYEIVKVIPEFDFAYYNVFTKAFRNDEVWDLIDKDNFNKFRKLIMRMNLLREEKINPNPEIQKHLERSKRVKSREKGLTLESMITSVVGFNGLSYENILDFTIYQLYATFYRIGQLKNHDITALYSVVSDVKVEDFSKHIDLFKDEDHVVDYDNFMKNIKTVLDDK